MTTTTKPPEWCALHDVALDALTADFTRYQLSTHGFITAFDDLVTWGFAEVKREPLFNGTTPAGETIHFRRARQRVLLVGCGKTKANTAAGPVPARDLYTGNLFTARRRYAEATGLPWFILSAEWGLVRPETELRSYDRTIKQLTAFQKSGWAMEVARVLADWTGKRLDELVVELHAGRDYYDALRTPWKPGEPPLIETPLEGLGIGQQLAWYAAK